MPIYPYSFQLPPLNVQDIPNDGAVGEFLGISAGGVLDWLPVSASGSGDMLKSENLSGLADYPTARTNLGLGTTDSPTFKNLVIATGSIATSAPVTISQTWNASAVAFTALKVNAVSTASASGSLLLDLQVGGVSKAYINKAGQLILPAGTSSAPSFCLQTGANGFYKLNNGFGYATDTDNPVLTANYNSALGMLSGMFLGWSTNVFTQPDWDVRLYKDGAGQLALRNGAAAQTFNIYGTYSSGSVYERMFVRYDGTALAFQVGTQHLGATARPLQLLTDNAARMTINTTGNVGIGTTAPAGSLHIRNDQAAFTGIYVDNRSGGSGSYSGISLGSNSSGGQQWFLTRENQTTARLDIALNLGSPFMSILAGGNVGIGTTAPSSKLQVTGGDVEIETVTSGIIMKAAGTSTRYRITLNAGGTALVFTAI
jgi:hypothetical protein